MAAGRAPAQDEATGRAAIVCGVDHSDGSRRALRVAASLAERLDSRLLFVNVRPTPASLPPGMASQADVFRERAVSGGRRLLEELRPQLLERARARHLLELVVGLVEFGDPATRLARVADEVRAAMIVVGSRGHGPTSSLLLGSVSQNLASSAARPVLVVPPGSENETQRSGATSGRPAGIVCGVDGTNRALDAVRIAARLATALRLRLVIAHVEPGGEEASPRAIESSGHPRMSTRSSVQIVQRAMHVAGDADVEGSLVQGDPSVSLRALAVHESAELIAVGTRGQGALKAFALGSVSRALAGSAPCPVLIVNARCSTGSAP